MNIRVSIFIIINISLFSSCKTTSSYFDQFNLNNNEKYYVFNTQERLKINSIEPFIVNNNIGLYNFIYSRDKKGNGEIIVRVLKFSDQHYLFENFEQADSIYNLFEHKYNTHFTKEEIADIKRLYRAGVIMKVMR